MRSLLTELIDVSALFLFQDKEKKRRNSEREDAENPRARKPNPRKPGTILHQSIVPLICRFQPNSRLDGLVDQGPSGARGQDSQIESEPPVHE